MFSRGPGKRRLSPASLTFTRTNYGTQTVRVTGVQDADASDESTSIALSARQSAATTAA